MGKSEVALEIASGARGEIINADSQQVYRLMNIGTGKPSEADRKRIPHHLIDVVDPDEEFNVAMFRRLATAAVHDVWSREKNIVVCGGSGLYLKALTRGLFIGPGQDVAVREALEKEIEARGLSGLYERLKKEDPGVAQRIHPNDRQRVIRALEIYELTGRPMSHWQEDHAFNESPFATLKIGLNRERGELYDLINRRCEKMLRDGLVEEVKKLLEMGYGLELKALRSVGYRHMALFLTGAATLDKSLMLMQRDTRRLAKRQLTWFRKDAEIRWFHPEREKGGIDRAIEQFLAER